MNIQEVLYTSSMATIFGLGLFVYGCSFVRVRYYA